MTQERIFLGMPGYGQLTAGASRGFWRASQNPDSLFWEYKQGSLLAANFNGLWAHALNLHASGMPIQYFAMQHADIEPEDYWLDILIAEMEARDLDMLGVVVPIKDTRGVTSIALARPDADTWAVHCRLTMQEVYRLPETFTGEDVGYPLLLNTGLWVCRFDPSWCKRLSFTINDRIVYDERGKRYIAQCEPEDWYFSRGFHHLGKRVGVTRKIQLSHRGDIEFTNAQPWGSNHDVEYISETVVPVGRFKQAKPQQFPHEVDGWLTPAEGRALALLASGKRVLEIGSYCGRSTICMAQTAIEVVSVDPHDGSGTDVPRHTYHDFLSNLERFEVRDKVLAMVGLFVDVVDDLHGKFDLIFVDGSHEYEDVCDDIERAVKLLDPNGVLVFHDYRMLGDEGVRLAVDEFISAGAEFIEKHESLAVVRPPAAVLLET